MIDIETIKKLYANDMATVLQQYYGILKIPHDADAQAFIAESEHRAVTVGGTAYSYYQLGNGPTILLVHGLHSNLGSMVPMARELVKQGYKTIVFDAPAHGAASGTHTYVPQVRDVIRAIGRDAGELHAMIGHSLGAFWALSAWNDTCRAKTLITVSSPSNHQFLIDKFVALHKLKKDVAKAIADHLETQFGKTMWVEYSPDALVKAISVPGLIIHDKNDDFVPSTHAQTLASNWSSAALKMIDCSAHHFLMMTSPVVRNLISEHLQELPAS